MIGCTFLFTGTWGDNWGNLFKGGGLISSNLQLYCAVGKVRTLENVT